MVYHAPTVPRVVLGLAQLARVARRAPELASAPASELAAATAQRWLRSSAALTLTRERSATGVAAAEAVFLGVGAAEATLGGV